ncbi:MAG: hypothetical protein PHX07_05340 [Candidatus Marinimicrobia bacterium]|nr:hypothetical protein [Candidatus Neomarinimicrobiota bacterium]MDD4961641.1 hypothetical protein [Candidatus Neomarinimicrobiota bacterium]MDD5710169.1 hypothetical protein [Candidatus Neomarinimicrobiota bacterium]
MDKTKKGLIAISLLIVFFSAFAEEFTQDVYFQPQTPYLPQIEKTLAKHELLLSSDSLNARYRGELLFYRDGDSIRCEIQLREAEELPFVLDAFMTEPADVRNVRRSLLNFSICLLILNAITAILFLLRSS